MFDTRSIVQIIHDRIEKVRNDIIENMDALKRNASKRSIKSLRIVTVGDDRAILYGERSFLVMERGRKAGRVPRNFHAIIKQWIIDKGIRVRLIPYKTNRPHKYTVQERSLNMAAGAIAYNIMTSGTRLHRMQEFDDIFTSSIEKNLEELNNELIFVASLEVDRIHQTL